MEDDESKSDSEVGRSGADDEVDENDALDVFDLKKSMLVFGVVPGW